MAPSTEMKEVEMIHLEHVNLVVNDIDAELAFYGAAFPHWRVRERERGNWYGKPRTWVHFGDDYQYLAISDFGEGENRNLRGHSVGFAHFAFAINNLHALVERMTLAGYKFDHFGPEVQFRKNVYYLDPDGFEIEFVEYLSDDPKERNS